MDMTRRGMVLGAAALATPAVAASAVNVTDLGVSPDAGRDQSQALQLALDIAGDKGLDLQLPPGKYIASGLRPRKPLTLLGSPGRSLIVSPGETILEASAVRRLTLIGLSFDGGRRKPTGGERQALVRIEAAEHLLIDACEFLGGASGLNLLECTGRVTGCRAAFIEGTGIFCFDSRGLEVSGNHVHDIGNNGIQVWRANPGEDGTIVVNNRVERVAAKDGGTGQNGNGINVWKAGNVLIANNRVSDCAFSAIRNNSGSNCQIVNNSCSRLDEKALYVEFAYEGAVVAGNIVEDAAHGISITNLDFGGRLVACSHNVVRRLRGGGSLPETNGVGISAEGEVAVSGNVVEAARDVGISLGWGPHCRNLSATGNVLRDCATGIRVSLAAGAQPALIANNIISGAKHAVIGMDHEKAVTGDLTRAGATMPERLLVQGNLVT